MRGSRARGTSAVGRRRRDVFCWALVVAGLAAWWAVVLGAPRLCAAGGAMAQIGAFGYMALSPVCHQEPSRCFWAWGAPLPICARCTGIWAGATLGVLTLPLLRGFSNRAIPHRRYIFAAAALVALDVASERVGLHGSVAWLRVAMGGALGLTAAWYVMPAILLATDERKEQASCSHRARVITT